MLMNLYEIDKNKAFLVSLKALIFQKERLLVIKNTAEKWGRKSQWELPGGLLEIDEGLKEGLIREVREETGLEISVGSVITAWDHWEHSFRFGDERVLDVRIVEIAFVCQRIGGRIVLSEEHSQLKWATRPELRRLDFAPNSKDAIRRYLELG